MPLDKYMSMIAKSMLNAVFFDSPPLLRQVSIFFKISKQNDIYISITYCTGE